MIFPIFLIMAGCYRPEVNSLQRKKNSSSWNTDEFISWIEVLIRFEDGKLLMELLENTNSEDSQKSFVRYISRFDFY